MVLLASETFDVFGNPSDCASAWIPPPPPPPTPLFSTTQGPDFENSLSAAISLNCHNVTM